jgi:hypothetical protein
VGLSVGCCSSGRHWPHVDDAEVYVPELLQISSAGMSGLRLRITALMSFSESEERR